MGLYDFELVDFRGNSFTLDKFRNKVIIIVNVASKCGLSETSYKRMHTILKEHGDKVILLLCPCKQFLNQEFATMDETVKFIQKHLDINNYKNVSNLTVNSDETRSNGPVLPKNVILTEALHVKGSHIDPLFDYLTNEKGGFITKSIKWNFSSFLIGKGGKVVKRYSPMDFPHSHDKNLLEEINKN